jgi:hypothetical protein
MQNVRSKKVTEIAFNRRQKGLDIPSAEMMAAAPKVPTLLVVIDTEEEFDWQAKFDRKNVGVSHISDLHRLQDIFVQHSMKPAYLVDYPIASSDYSANVFRKLVQNGDAVVGAHLHPWVNPPFDEIVSAENSYPGNLSTELEAAKLEILMREILVKIGVTPQMYKAGRYGISKETPKLLNRLGFLTDHSACPGYDFSIDGGPMYVGHPNGAYWFSESKGVLEIPTTAGYASRLTFGRGLVSRDVISGKGSAFEALRTARLIQRIRLSPEGYELRYLQQLTLQLLQSGVSLLTLTLHSPSVALGMSPYSKTSQDRDNLLSTVDRYLRWFKGSLGGNFSTPIDERSRILANGI